MLISIEAPFSKIVVFDRLLQTKKFARTHRSRIFGKVLEQALRSFPCLSDDSPKGLADRAKLLKGKSHGAPGFNTCTNT